MADAGVRTRRSSSALAPSVSPPRDRSRRAASRDSRARSNDSKHGGNKRAKTMKAECVHDHGDLVGISIHCGRWRVRFSYKNSRMEIGNYKDPTAAGKAYDRYCIAMRGTMDVRTNHPVDTYMDEPWFHKMFPSNGAPSASPCQPSLCSAASSVASPPPVAIAASVDDSKPREEASSSEVPDSEPAAAPEASRAAADDADEPAAEAKELSTGQDGAAEEEKATEPVSESSASVPAEEKKEEEVSEDAAAKPKEEEQEEGDRASAKSEAVVAAEEDQGDDDDVGETPSPPANPPTHGFVGLFDPRLKLTKTVSSTNAVLERLKAFFQMYGLIRGSPPEAEVEALTMPPAAYLAKYGAEERPPKPRRREEGVAEGAEEEPATAAAAAEDEAEAAEEDSPEDAREGPSATPTKDGDASAAGASTPGSVRGIGSRSGFRYVHPQFHKRERESGLVGYFGKYAMTKSAYIKLPLREDAASAARDVDRMLLACLGTRRSQASFSSGHLKLAFPIAEYERESWWRSREATNGFLDKTRSLKIGPLETDKELEDRRNCMESARDFLLKYFPEYKPKKKSAEKAGGGKPSEKGGGKKKKAGPAERKPSAKPSEAVRKHRKRTAEEAARPAADAKPAAAEGEAAAAATTAADEAGVKKAKKGARRNPAARIVHRSRFGPDGEKPKSGSKKRAAPVSTAAPADGSAPAAAPAAADGAAAAGGAAAAVPGPSPPKKPKRTHYKVKAAAAAAAAAALAATANLAPGERPQRLKKRPRRPDEDPPAPSVPLALPAPPAPLALPAPPPAASSSSSAAPAALTAPPRDGERPKRASRVPIARRHSEGASAAPAAAPAPSKPRSRANSAGASPVGGLEARGPTPPATAGSAEASGAPSASVADCRPPPPPAASPHSSHHSSDHGPTRSTGCGYLGVRRNPGGGFRAQLQIFSGKVPVGGGRVYATAEEAARARERLAIVLVGPLAAGLGAAGPLIFPVADHAAEGWLTRLVGPAGAGIGFRDPAALRVLPWARPRQADDATHGRGPSPLHAIAERAEAWLSSILSPPPAPPSAPGLAPPPPITALPLSGDAGRRRTRPRASGSRQSSAPATPAAPAAPAALLAAACPPELALPSPARGEAGESSWVLSLLAEDGALGGLPGAQAGQLVSVVRPLGVSLAVVLAERDLPHAALAARPPDSLPVLELGASEPVWVLEADVCGCDDPVPPELEEAARGFRSRSFAAVRAAIADLCDRLCSSPAALCDGGGPAALDKKAAEMAAWSAALEASADAAALLQRALYLLSSLAPAALTPAGAAESATCWPAVRAAAASGDPAELEAAVARAAAEWIEWRCPLLAGARGPEAGEPDFLLPSDAAREPPPTAATEAARGGSGSPSPAPPAPEDEDLSTPAPARVSGPPPTCAPAPPLEKEAGEAPLVHPIAPVAI